LLPNRKSCPYVEIKAELSIPVQIDLISVLNANTHGISM